MTALGALDAERIKLLTLRSPLWCAATAALLSFMMASAQAAFAYGFSPMSASAAAIGVVLVGVPVLTIVAAMTVTGEYRSDLMSVTFTATPSRAVVMCAKAVVAAVFSALVAGATVVGSVLVAYLTALPAGPAVTGQLAAQLPAVAASIALYAALSAVLGVGIAALLRHTAGVVAVLLLWPLVVEPVLGNLPGRAAWIGAYLPFANIFRFVGAEWLVPVSVMPWSVGVSVAYFTAVVAVLFAAALVVVNRRDA